MSERKKFPQVKITTPKGRAKFPRLDTPDTKFKEGGQYSVKLILTGDDALALVAKIDAAADETYAVVKDEIAALKSKEKNPTKRAAIPERADPSYKEIYGDDEQPTGEYEFNFKMLASGVSKKDGKPWTRKPAVFDAKGKPITNVAGANIGGGSTVRVSAVLDGFWTAGLGAGVSLKLEAVQVIECRSYGAKTASEHGFGEEEGFSAEDVADAPSEDAKGDEPSDPSDF